MSHRLEYRQNLKALNRLERGFFQLEKNGNIFPKFVGTLFLGYSAESGTSFPKGGKMFQVRKKTGKNVPRRRQGCRFSRSTIPYRSTQIWGFGFQIPTAVPRFGDLDFRIAPSGGRVPHCESVGDIWAGLAGESPWGGTLFLESAARGPGGGPTFHSLHSNSLTGVKVFRTISSDISIH